MLDDQILELHNAILVRSYTRAAFLISAVERRYDSLSLTDKHFFLQFAAQYYYKQRNVQEDALRLCVSYCCRDIELFPTYAPAMLAFFGDMPHIETFHRLAIIYEKAGEYELAIDLCRLAQSYGLSDWTKGDYAGRIARLEKKLQKEQRG